MKWRSTTTKTSSEVLPSKVLSLGVFVFQLKKTITEVLLILPLYLILLFIWYRFRHLIKIMADVGDILNDNDFVDVVDTPKECIEQHKKWECLKDVMSMGKVHLLGHKWTHGRVDKASDETINKTYAEYKQREPNEKGEKTERPRANMSLICIPPAFLDGLKSRMLKNYNRTLRTTQSLKIKWRI